jgi:hypothetical protein
VSNLDRVERLPDASRRVHHDEADRVNELLVDFLTPLTPSSYDPRTPRGQPAQLC